MADNQQRAAEVLDLVPLFSHENAVLAVAVALDESETRGRTEVATKVRGLHFSLLEDLDSEPRCHEDGDRWPCDTEKTLRALIAEVTR